MIYKWNNYLIVRKKKLQECYQKVCSIELYKKTKNNICKVSFLYALLNTWN